MVRADTWLHFGCGASPFVRTSATRTFTPRWARSMGQRQADRPTTDDDDVGLIVSFAHSLSPVERQPNFDVSGHIRGSKTFEETHNAVL